MRRGIEHENIKRVNTRKHEYYLKWVEEGETVVVDVLKSITHTKCNFKPSSFGVRVAGVVSGVYELSYSEMVWKEDSKEKNH